MCLQRRLKQFSKLNLKAIKSRSLLKHCYLTRQEETRYSTLKSLWLKTNTPLTQQFKPSGTTTSTEKTGLFEPNSNISWRRTSALNRFVVTTKDMPQHKPLITHISNWAIQPQQVSVCSNQHLARVVLPLMPRLSCHDYRQKRCISAAAAFPRGAATTAERTTAPMKASPRFLL